MKKKMLSLILAVGLMSTVLSGCSLFATNIDEPKGAAGSSGAVKLTDNYTFEDPADLDFDTRYVLYCDENSQMISSASAEYGLKASYSSIYAKDDAPVMDYEFLVCDSAEHALATIDLYASQGQALQVAENDATVLCSSTDGDTMEATLAAFQSYGMLSEPSVAAYVEFMQTSTGGKLME